MTPDKNSPIGVFDSGIGGLTVLKALTQNLPQESFVYFGDTARVPYGSKSDPIVKQFALQNCFFLMKHNVKFIVIACNTASSVALEFLQQRLSVPVIGVIEPGARAALAAGSDKTIGVIGTTATIASNAYQKTLKTLNPDAKIISRACPLFVPMVEEGLIDGEVPQVVIRHYLQNMQNIGSLILGCTHYPLLQKNIADYLGPDVAIIDSPSATAALVKSELLKLGLISDSRKYAALRFFASDISPGFVEQSRRFFGGSLPEVEKVEFEVADFWV